MSTGLYSITTRASGTILTAAIYNADHQNHVTNQNPSMTGAYSDDITQYKLQTNPGGVGSESLASSLAGELERIRYILAKVMNTTYWYDYANSGVLPVSDNSKTYAAAVSGATVISNLATFSDIKGTITDGGTAVANVARGGFRNRLHSASCSYWPFGVGSISVATGTPSLTLSNNNRIQVGHIIGCAGATVACQRAAAAGTFQKPRTQYLVGLTGQVGITDAFLRFTLSAQEASVLAGRKCTFQLRALCQGGASGTPQISSKYPTATDDWTSSTADLAATNLQTLVNGTEQVLAYTFNVSANAAKGYEVTIDLNTIITGASYVFYYGEWDFGEDQVSATGLNSAPPTAEIPYEADDKKRCQERVYTTYANGTAPGTATHTNIRSIPAVGNGTNVGSGEIRFPTEMISTPSISFWDGAGTASKVSTRYDAAFHDGSTGTEGPVGTYGVLFDTTASILNCYIHVFADADILGG